MKVWTATPLRRGGCIVQVAVTFGQLRVVYLANVGWPWALTSAVRGLTAKADAWLLTTAEASMAKLGKTLGECG